MEAIITCPGLRTCFEVKRALEDRGLIYIRNARIRPSRGVNYIGVDALGLFALISEQEAHASNEPLLRPATALQYQNSINYPLTYKSGLKRNKMNIELKKAIIIWMFDNANEFQLLNATTNEFRQYIYTPDGNYCIGGEVVADFIRVAEKIVKY